jgi:hypothetical protein
MENKGFQYVNFKGDNQSFHKDPRHEIRISDPQKIQGLKEIF